jgi:CubicO group peptidase (beta-lactamase class C family)
VSNASRSAVHCILLALTSLSTVPASASSDPRAAQTDKVFAEWNKPDSPGCVCGVMQKGETLYVKGFGSADLEHEVPITPNSVFYIASTSKQFTAASIALLSLDGKVGLKDDVRKYLPEIRDYGTPISVEQLVFHTSGMRDYLELRALAGWSDYDKLDNDMAIELIARQKALNFTPGSRYSYSNSGYVMLAQIVKRASGTPMAKFAKERIFAPLGMNTTHFGDDAGEIVPNRVISYGNTPEGKRVQYIKTIEAYGDGNLLTTMPDLMRWHENFYSGKVGGPTFLELLKTRGVLNDGKSLDYGFGLVFGKHRGIASVSHGGGFLGFRTELLRFPEQQLSVGVLCNFASANPGGLARQVADLYLTGGEEAPAPVADRPQTPAPVPFVPKPGSLRAFAGNYHSDEIDAALRVMMEGDRLIARDSRNHSVPLEPKQQDVFGAPGGGEVTFRRNGSGAVDAIVYSSGRITSLVFERRAE